MFVARRVNSGDCRFAFGELRSGATFRLERGVNADDYMKIYVNHGYGSRPKSVNLRTGELARVEVATPVISTNVEGEVTY